MYFAYQKRDEKMYETDMCITSIYNHTVFSKNIW